MMKHKYLLHPSEYEIGENEKFYSDMAAKGLLLVKRGNYFSKFEKAEPQRLLYRIELSNPEFLEDSELPEEQISVYEDCGWNFVCTFGLINVFCAPENSGAPEFYENPQQQAATLKALRRQYRGSFIILVLAIAFIALMSSSLGRSFSKGFAEIKIALVEHTAVELLYCLFLCAAIFELIYGGIKVFLLYRRLKSGKALDHAPKKGPRFHTALRNAAIAVSAVLLLLAVIGYTCAKFYDMPEVSDGPYMLLSDMGFFGQRGHVYYMEKTSRVEHVPSLAADCWHTYECLNLTENKSVWMYQKIYFMRSKNTVRGFADALMQTVAFHSSFTEVHVEGLDFAWKGFLEYIGIKDEKIYFITFSEDGAKNREYPVLEYLSEYLNR